MLAEMKEKGEPIVMVTAYDYPSALIVEEAGVDVVLVGDSAANNVLGYDSTVPVGMDEMLMLASAVRRGLKTPLLIGDMPFGSYEESNEQAVETPSASSGKPAVRRSSSSAAVSRWIAPSDRPSRHPGHGARRVDPADAHSWAATRPRARRPSAPASPTMRSLQEAGCFAIVFEAIPAAITQALMPSTRSP